jgi:hypothetical protein
MAGRVISLASKDVSLKLQVLNFLLSSIILKYNKINETFINTIVNLEQTSNIPQHSINKTIWVQQLMHSDNQAGRRPS